MSNIRQSDGALEMAIRQRSLKVTPVRVAILAALAWNHEPISIKKIGDIVKDHNESTLYRALEAMVKAKLVKQITFDSSKSLYETTIGRPHHHHIVCTSCGLVEGINTCIKTLSTKILSTKNFRTITDHSLEFFGLCIKCSPKTSR